MVPGWEQIAWMVMAGLCGGMINAVAGGGTLLTFPVMLAAGMSVTEANAGSMVALWPAYGLALWTSRGSLQPLRSLLPGLALASLAGGIAGAAFLLWLGNAAYSHLLPWLALLATLVYALSGYFHASPARSEVGGHFRMLPWWQLLVAWYGGFFGAGMGFLMLALYALSGVAQIAQQNALKNWASMWVVSVAIAVYGLDGQIKWVLALPVACGAVLGGWCGGTLAGRLSATWFRTVVVLAGLGLSGGLWARQHGLF